MAPQTRVAAIDSASPRSTAHQLGQGEVLGAEQRLPILDRPFAHPFRVAADPSLARDRERHARIVRGGHGLRRSSTSGLPSPRCRTTVGLPSSLLTATVVCLRRACWPCARSSPSGWTTHRGACGDQVRYLTFQVTGRAVREPTGRSRRSCGPRAAAGLPSARAGVRLGRGHPGHRCRGRRHGGVLSRAERPAPTSAGPVRRARAGPPLPGRSVALGTQHWIACMNASRVPGSPRTRSAGRKGSNQRVAGRRSRSPPRTRWRPAAGSRAPAGIACPGTGSAAVQIPCGVERDAQRARRPLRGRGSSGSVGRG